MDKQLLDQVQAEYNRMIAEMFTASVKDQLAFQRELAQALKPPHRH